MLEPVRLLLAPAMHAAAAIKDRRSAAIPRPTDLPHVNAGGPASDRVLIFGSGPAVGWGVLTHDLALPGALARALTARTGRGTDIDVVADPTLTISSPASATRLASLKLWRYDAVVIVGGINEAVGLMPPKRWERGLASLLATVRAATSRGTRVFVVGIQPIRSIRLYDDLLGSIAAAHATVLNSVSARLCDQDDRAGFIPLPAPPSENGRYRSADAYRVWAAALADGMAMVMDGAYEEAGGDRGISYREESDRQHAVDELGIVDTAPEARYDRIVSMARQLFGTESAAFSITDHDRQWYKSRVGIDLAEIDRDKSFCAPTVERRGPDDRAGRARR